MPHDLEATGARSIPTARLRQVMGHFPTGVTVITGMDGSEPVGFTAQSFMSLSLDPPLVLLAAMKASTSWPRIRASGAFCANILSDEQEDVSRAFAVSGGDKFRGIGWNPAPGSGSPLIRDSLAFVDARIKEELDGGDHTIVVAEILDLGVEEDAGPLLFYRGGYASLDRD